MKKYLKLSKITKIGLFILIGLQLISCSPKDYGDMKKNNLKVDDYNEITECYNKMASSFTSFVVSVNKELKKGEKDSTTQILAKYDEKSEGLVNNIKNVEEKEFKYDEVEKSMDYIKPMISNMYKYLDYIKDIEEVDLKQIPEFKEEIDELYEEIVNQSISVASILEEIHQSFLVRKKDE